MTTLKDKLFATGFADQILTDVDLNGLLEGSPAARYGMVNKALKKGELVRVRRGLYMLAEQYRHTKLSAFFLANRIVPHSYISLESALSYHGWIPERVTTVTSVLALGRTKQFITPFGEFVFYRIPINDYEFLTAVSRIAGTQSTPFLLASPLRALADLVYVRKIDWQGINYLTDSLRIDRGQLMAIEPQHFIEAKRIYRSQRVLIFLEKLNGELKK